VERNKRGKERKGKHSNTIFIVINHENLSRRRRKRRSSIVVLDQQWCCFFAAAVADNKSHQCPSFQSNIEFYR